MSTYHLMHCKPLQRVHGFSGYLEIIQSIEWGLKQLGHEVTYAENTAVSNAINIVFGAQSVPIEYLKRLPKNSIIFNLEQYRGVSPSFFGKEVHFCAENFEIWEYSSANMHSWQLLGNDNHKLVPISYAPILTRIPKVAEQDIEVLIYGLSGEKRLFAFDELSTHGIVTIFVSGLYGAARDNLISRSKIILNVNLYDYAQIFEIARVSYLLSNSKAVISMVDEDTFIEDDLKTYIKKCNLETLLNECLTLLESDAKRLSYEKMGFDIFQKRDIRETLRGVLANN